MKKLLLLILLLPACGDSDSITVLDSSSQSCSVVETPDGAQISCPDGSSAVISDGKDCHHGKPDKDELFWNSIFKL